MSTAGALRERVTLQMPAITLTDAGDPVNGWSDTATIWARMDAVKVSEITRAMRDTVEARYRCTIRYRDGVIETMRVIWRGRVFTIEGITNPDERRRFLTIDLLETRI